jgi:aminodeoxyfutalosine synthase
MAGSKEESPAMTTDEIRKLILEAGFVPVERDSLYKPIKEW